MALTKPATQNTASEWLPMAEGMWRFTVGAPQIREKASQWGDYIELTFPLTLTESEQERLIQQVGEPGQGQQQSYRVWVRGKVVTAMGYFKGGKYQTTDCGLAELMCAAVGASGAKTLRQWMMDGGVPFVSPDATEAEEIEELISFYSWFENLELYATIRHDPDKNDKTKVWPRIQALLPIGSLPGQAEENYQRSCIGKVRSITSGNPAPKVEATVPEPEPEPVPAAEPPRTSNQPANPVSQMTAEEKAAKYRELFGEDAPIPQELVTA